MCRQVAISDLSPSRDAIDAKRSNCAFEFLQEGDDIRIASEKHYRLVPPDDVTNDDLAKYSLKV